MNDPHAPLREVRRWMRVSTPVNKAASSGLRGRLPQIAGPLMIGALGVGALGAGIAWRALSSTRGTGRTQRFVDLATAALDSRFPERVTDEAGAGVNDAGSGQHRVVNVEVGEGFGRPSLVSIDVVLPAQDALTDPVTATLALDEITRATWNNPEMARPSPRRAHGQRRRGLPGGAGRPDRRGRRHDRARLRGRDRPPRRALQPLRRARGRPRLEAVTGA